MYPLNQLRVSSLSPEWHLVDKINIWPGRHFLFWQVWPIWNFCGQSCLLSFAIYTSDSEMFQSSSLRQCPLTHCLRLTMRESMEITLMDLMGSITETVSQLSIRFLPRPSDWNIESIPISQGLRRSFSELPCLITLSNAYHFMCGSNNWQNSMV